MNMLSSNPGFIASSFHDHGTDPLESNSIPNHDVDEVADFSNSCLKFIGEILLEEDLDDDFAALHDQGTLQATEKSFYDALDGSKVESFPPVDGTCQTSESNSQSSGSLNSFDDVVNRLAISPISTLLDSEVSYQGEFDWFTKASKYASDCSCNSDARKAEMLVYDEYGENVFDGRTGRKNHERDDNSDQEERRHKHLATYNEEYVDMEQYDDVLLLSNGGKDSLSFRSIKLFDKETSQKAQRNKNSRRLKPKTDVKEQSGNGSELVDLSALLLQCAQAAASFDLRTTNELLKKIRKHSSPHGDSIERVAHYFADGLEARLAGTGSEISKTFFNKRIPSSEVLKAYQVQFSATPFRGISYFLANKSILKLAKKATKIHIIDFGIFFGFQWPSLIQSLSELPTGCPRLRVTGIDYPQRGFRPAEVVQETGNRLRGYCERFDVPFEYHAIAQNWETIKRKDLKIDGDELVVINSLYMSRKLLDETVEETNPRDAFFRFIRKLNPDLFIHGIVSGTYSAPYFMTRFREALFHYSCIFDMFEATIPREDNARLLLENHLYGKDALNAIACEGTERVERPETYKKWHVRKLNAGFKPIAFDPGLLNGAKTMVKENYHKDFLVDADKNWVLQGWKGRVLYAMSCWKPA